MASRKSYPVPLFKTGFIKETEKEAKRYLMKKIG